MDVSWVSISLQNSYRWSELIDILLCAGLHEKHKQELENLTLTTQPLKTIKFFILAIIQYLKKVILYLLGHGAWLTFLSSFLVLGAALLMNTNGPHEKVLKIF